MTTPVHPFKADRRLKINIAFAIALVILCPLALWQFYFRHEFAPENKIDASELVRKYCLAYNQPTFHSAEVFAPEVRKYLSDTLQTPVNIDHTVAIDRQTRMYPRVRLLPDSIYVYSGMNEQIVYAWIQEIQYMKLIRQYRKVDNRYEFIFNSENKIVSLELIDSRYETFSSTMP